MEVSWIAERKALVSKMRNLIEKRFGTEALRIAGYSEKYEAEFKKNGTISSWSELLKKSLRAEFLLGADFHAFRQAQRVHLRFLRRWPKGKPLTLALEVFDEDHQPFLDLYLKGRLSETAFLEAVTWVKRWGFPWEHYRPLLELAKAKGFRVIGINSKAGRGLKGLKKRDQVAAKILTQSFERNPMAHYVLVGELHLAESHLPAEIRRLSQNAKILKIHLVSDESFFRLAKRGLDAHVDVLRLGKNDFSLVTSPPWVKWQTYLLFLENNFDLDLDEGGVDFTDHVLALLQVLRNDLMIKKWQPSLNEIDVRLPAYEEVSGLHFNGLSNQEQALVEQMLTANEGLFLPPHTFLITQATVNHTADLAGQFLHFHLSGAKELSWNVPAQIQCQIWREAIGFFCSKLINPKRRAPTLHDLQMQVDVFETGTGREAVLIALDIRLKEMASLHHKRVFRDPMRPRRRVSYLIAARFLGAVLGERLFAGYESGHFPLNYMVDLMKVNPESKKFSQFYWSILRRLEDLESDKWNEGLVS